jgi:protein-tyrosine phosphatase
MFTDLHCHLLFAIDDGPTEAAGSLAMAKLLVSLGFETVVPTPHALPQFPGESVARERMAELASLLAQEKVALRLELGAENRLDQLFMEAELSGKGRHLGRTSCTLVEAPYESVVPALPDLLFRLRRKGVVPVLAHPERCAEFQEIERAHEAVRLGAVMQLDVGSLTGTYGKQAKRTALKMLEVQLYSLAATDLHDPEDGEWLAGALAELEKRVGKPGRDRLLATNPARLLKGEELS